MICTLNNLLHKISLQLQAQSISKLKFPLYNKPLRIEAPTNISPSKSPLKKQYMPRGLFSELYGNLSSAARIV